MKSSITVERAIRKGKKRSNYFLVSFFIFSFIIIVGLSSNLFTEKAILNPEFSFPIGIFTALIVYIFLSNKLSSKWKLWAFKNVRNVHELKRRAIDERLIYSNSPFMEKAEFKSKEEKEEWDKILLKFNIEDILVENKKLPQTIHIYYSIQKNIYKSLGYIIIFLFWVLLIVNQDFSFFLTFFMMVTIVFALSKIFKIFNRKPQLTFCIKGIIHRKNELMKWDDIKSEYIVNDSRHSELFLIYKNQEKSINIKDMDVTIEQIKDYLETYRIRNKNAN